MNKRDFLYCLMFFYLGFALKHFLNIGIDKWEWWVISAPLWIIVSYNETKINKNEQRIS